MTEQCPWGGTQTVVSASTYSVSPLMLLYPSICAEAVAGCMRAHVPGRCSQTHFHSQAAGLSCKHDHLALIASLHSARKLCQDICHSSEARDWQWHVAVVERHSIFNRCQPCFSLLTPHDKIIPHLAAAYMQSAHVIARQLCLCMLKQCNLKRSQ